jgi:hypothetical protein
MIRDFGLAGRDWGTIARVCEPERSTWVGPSRHIRWEQGVVVIGFGKHAGMPMHVVASSEHRDYLQWVLGKDFPRHVHAICRAALELCGDEFLRWVAQTFGSGVAEPRPRAAIQHGNGERRAAGH